MFRPVLLLFSAVLVVASDPGYLNLQGSRENPFQSQSKVRVLLFVRTDCPITNRYAPQLQQIAGEYKNDSVQFWLVYPDRTETPANVRLQLEQYHLPGIALFDPRHELVHQAHATVAPEAAVFDQSGTLRYHGRIDNRWADIGKSRPSATVHDLEDAIAAILQGKPVRETATRAIGCGLADIE